MQTKREGVLFVISAPSGTGKSTLARKLVENVEGLEFSISYTTRRARAGEQDGREYHFAESQEFDRMIRDNAFLEWARVFEQRYGTGLERTRGILASGRDLLLDIDVQGAAQVRTGPVPAVSVMILPPDYATLEARLRGRGSEGGEQVAGRLARAREEARQYDSFDYMLVNDRLDDTLGGLQAIVRAERRRAVRCDAEARRILETFPVRV